MSGILTELIVPFSYDYMWKAMWVSALVGAVCAFLSCYLMLKGWSLMGDALGHSIVPGVAGAYIIGAPFAAGAFFAGILAALGMAFVKAHSRLREDATIGLVFTTLFALGLLMASLYPTSVSIQTIVLGNILAIPDADALQVVIIAVVSFAVLAFIWKDLMVTFFDETYARSIGLRTRTLKLVFFTLLSACTVAALQTVGACLVIALVVTPGATAYLLTDRFDRLIAIAVGIGTVTSFVGAYLSYFIDGATGGVIVTLQTLLFLAAFYFAPKHGVIAAHRKARAVRDENLRNGSALPESRPVQEGA
ncbi:metal ABC transporter permease [Methyloceanibacter caenitepidi]|uniref:Manganese ABC transporter, inner membrane permease protein SitC n=1 Tax=Methyloceanibacter caenitepidi TaxID=1384459 RepID=A0A0A8JZI6_9HYPH|nr:metal ABC transporter permease [Methyloceanibacter caenitepidi]BAQ16228.1 manganese ABC transporter, inner membrane permease protein SitC [Methyloceanibacter caenitepidi]